VGAFNPNSERENHGTHGRRRGFEPDLTAGKSSAPAFPSSSVSVGSVCSVVSTSVFGFKPNSEVRIPMTEPRPNSEDQNPKSRRLEKSSRRPNRNTFGLRPSDLVRISDFGVRVQAQASPPDGFAEDPTRARRGPGSLALHNSPRGSWVITSCPASSSRRISAV